MKAGLIWLANAFGVKHGASVAYAYRNLFAAGEGRLVLDDLARYCRAGTTSFVANDPHQTAFNEGARDAFLHIAELAGLTPADIAQLFASDSSQENSHD